jgi:dolichyl-phosphate-mannose-protein mannosyltransferase
MTALFNEEPFNPETPVTQTTPVEAIAAPQPAVPMSRWQKFWRWEYTGLIIILLVTLGFHFAAIERPNSIIWDEKWYVGDARSIITGSGDLRPEHPPLAKLFMVAGEYIFNGFKVPIKNTNQTLLYAMVSGSQNTFMVEDASAFQTGTTLKINKEQMKVISINTEDNQITVERDSGGTGTESHVKGAQIFVFTDNAFGWRFFSIVFGTLGIVIFFFICRKLKLSLLAALIGTFIFAFEDMTFLHSSLALLDVYMVTFMLAAVLMYLNESYIPAGILVALSAHCKLVGVLIIFAMLIHWAIYRRNKWNLFVAGLLTAAVSYVLFMMLFDFFIVGGFEDPIHRIVDMLSGTSANVFTDPKLSISSYPWTWIYPQFVQLYYNSPNVPFIVYGYDPQYISFISSTVQIVIIPTFFYMVYKMAKGSQTAGLIVLWFLTTYVLWLPLTAITNRVTFVFYFLSTTPAICIGIAIAISDMLGWVKRRREQKGKLTAGGWVLCGFIGFYLTIHLAIFVVFNPAIPTIIKTWLPPFSIGVDPTHSSQLLAALLKAI